MSEKGLGALEPWLARLALASYAAFLILLAFVGFYIIFYVIFLVSFLCLVPLVDKMRWFDIADSHSFQRKMLLVFVMAMVVRMIMLAQDQIVTDDILNYVLRGERMLNGEIPYTDDFYGGSKPPLHNLVLFLISGTLGAGAVQFRFAFSVVDSLIAVMILFLSERDKGGRFLLSASLLYALSPINVITIGLSGHFDPVPTIAVVVSAVFLISRRRQLSSLFLGLGLALKVFAGVLLPYYAGLARAWKDRIVYLVLFALPMTLSLLGLYLLNPNGPLNYLNETSGWGGWWSFSHLFSVAIGSKVVGGLKVSWLFMGLFLLLILLMYISMWVRKDEDERIVILWYKIALLIAVAYLGLMILDAWAQAPSGTDVLPYGILFTVFVLVAGFLLFRYRDALFPSRLDGGRTERILVVTTLAAMLFCFGLPNYAPWYTIWFLPFLLAVKTKRIRFSLLLLSVWHIMGKGVSLWPGFPPIN